MTHATRRDKLSLNFLLFSERTTTARGARRGQYSSRGGALDGDVVVVVREPRPRATAPRDHHDSARW
eukprot:29026-Pelagococcus_subviridis.AAC.16